jgi:hypothetical protein
MIRDFPIVAVVLPLVILLPALFFLVLSGIGWWQGRANRKLIASWRWPPL